MKRLREILYILLILGLMTGNVYQFFGLRKCHRHVRAESKTVIDTTIRLDQIRFDSVPAPQPEIIDIKNVKKGRAKLGVISPLVGAVFSAVTRSGRDSIKVPPIQVSADTAQILDADQIQKYSGQVERDGVGIHYDHFVRGTLLWSNYRLTYPSQVITKTDKTIISPIARYNVFTVKGLHVHPTYTDVTVGAGFTNKKLVFIYQYGLGQRSHHVAGGVRLFGK